MARHLEVRGERNEVFVLHRDNIQTGGNNVFSSRARLFVWRTAREKGRCTCSTGVLASCVDIRVYAVEEGEAAQMQ